MSPDFSQTVITALSRRAALRCSNPDCDKLTTGPNTDIAKVTNIGEAAHIYGARYGAARYRVEMTDQERASISNGIWLCSDCHGLIDKDPNRFSPELLLTWKNAHEEKIINELGKTGDKIRNNILDKEMQEFSNLPAYARQIIRDKPEFWEHILSAELLDYYWAPIFRKAKDLERKLIAKHRVMVDFEQFPRWLQNKLTEIQQAPISFGGLLEEIQLAWGRQGEDGDALEIVHVCQLFAKTAQHLVDISEDLIFANVPEGFEEVTTVLAEGSLHTLKHLPEFPQFMRSIIGESSSSGSHTFELVIALPDGWAEKIDYELKSASANLERRDFVW